MQTNSSSDIWIASSTQPLWIRPSNLNSWLIICLCSILAAFPKNDGFRIARSLWQSKVNIFLESQKNISSTLVGFKLRNLSLSLVEWLSESDDPIPNCSSLCLYKLTKSVSLTTTGPSVLSFVSTVYMLRALKILQGIFLSLVIGLCFPLHLLQYGPFLCCTELSSMTYGISALVPLWHHLSV